MKKSAPILLQESSALRSGNLAHLSNAVLKVTGEGKVEVTIHSRDPVGPEQQRDLVGLEATILEVAVTPPPELHLPRFGLVDVLIPLSRIEEAAELPWVTAITPPGYADSDSHPVNPTNSEGVAIHFADLAQSLGVDGTGVTIGVISSGVANLAIAQNNGELPAVTVFNSGGLDEGTAMLEIVHDMAPGATLLYDDGAGTSSSNITRHFNALINLAANGANVIAEDLFFNTEPMFQQGLLAQTAEALAASGISIHSSAGNRAQNHAARVVAVGTGAGPDGVNGPFTGCTVNPTNAVAITSVNGNDTTFDLVLGTDNTPPPSGPNGSVFVLQWSEPRQIFPSIGRGGFTNLDLFVMDAALTTCLGESSVVQQNGVGDTIEIVAMPAAMAGTPVKVVVNVTGTSSAVAPPTLDLRWVTTQSETNFPTAAGSLNPDSNYIGLASSSAAFLAGSSALATTSSQGPIQLGSTTICPGGLPGPCVGVAGPGLTSFPGPTWTAVSGVSISGAGGFGSPSATGACPAINPGDCRFFGTSAAAPHAAACDALVRDAIANPTSAVAPIAARLASTARFAGNGNVNAAGAGLLDCLDAVGPPNARCIANQTVPTDPGVCRVDSLIPIDNGSSDPNGDPIAISQTPAPPYLLGANVITLNVTETSAGALSDSCTTTITVIDEVPPEITAPDDIVAECTSPDGTPVDLGDPDVSDICDADVDVRNDAPDLFPL
ncbi:MAG: S8 family serine peptidase, partial [Gammaproteobacteria bacterium]